MKRLGTEYIDLYQIHYQDGKTPLKVVVETLEGLKKEGKIRYYGLSNIHENDMVEIEELVGKFVSFQDEYSLACRKNEKDILKISKELKMTPMTWGSLGQGILTGKYDKTVSFVVAVAIRYILDYLPQSVALCGAKRPSQIIGNVEGVDWKLNKEEIQKLEEVSK